MDHDTVSPFALYFQDDSFVLRETVTGDRRDEATLWLSFYAVDGTVSLGAFDGVLSAYSHEFTGGPREVAPFIASVEAAYGVRVPEQFTTLPVRFLELLPEAFGVLATLRETTTSCEACGSSNGDTLEAFYFPPLEDGAPGSFGVHNDFGCYGGIAVFGSTDDPVLLAKGISILEQAIESAKEQAAAEEVRAFLAKLQAV